MTDLMRLFTRAHKLLRAATDEGMSRYGVRVGQNLVLEVLWVDDGLTPRELGERLGVATPTVVKSATRMEAAGLVERRRDPHDARLVRLYLTDHGRSVQKDIKRVRAELAEHAFATLTDAERAHLESALAKIVERMTE